MGNTTNILKWIRETNPKNLPYNITGIGWGPKITNDIKTDEYCLVFYVLEKKKIDYLNPEQIIPKYIDVKNISVRTDVQTAQIHQTLLLQDCHSGATSYNPPEPIASNRKKYRPLKGGISSISNNSSDGTLGLFVRDKSDGSVVALSNNHVYAATQVSSRSGRRNDYTVTQNSPDRMNTLSISAIQPALITYNPYGAPVPTSLSGYNVDYIGNCKRSVVLGNIGQGEEFVLINGQPYWFIDVSCDAAIVQLSSNNLLNSDSMNIVGFSQQGPYQFATDEEIDSLLDPDSPNYKSPIFRSGRTCGPVGYPGYFASCFLETVEFLPALVGVYSQFYIGNFKDCFIVYGYEQTVPGRGGDSGSALFAYLSSNIPEESTWKCIGLLFAGPNSAAPNYTIGCRITNIVKDLGVMPWNGTFPSLSSNTSIINVSNNSTGVIELSGRKFYQLGMRSYN